MSRNDNFDGQQRSDSRPRSGAAVRDVPVQRSTAYAGQLPSSTSTVVDYRSSSSPWGDFHQEEYYRKEVRTRTYVTRSTETLSAPPLSSSSPVERDFAYQPLAGDDQRPRSREPQRTVDLSYKYVRNVEEEERRIRMDQEQRHREEEKRRRRAEEEQRQWELHERELLERKQRELDMKHRELEGERLERERLEKLRLDRDRQGREQAEMQRRAEWERYEQARREHEELELHKWREMERKRLEQIRLEEQRKERERLEHERMERERERLLREQAERERLERERIERERIETERLEIERIERLKREREEKEKLERDREKQEKERIEKERLEKERIAREKERLLRIEEELLDAARREARIREEERIAEETREARRREQERRDAELIAELQRKAEEREAQRRMSERLEADRLLNLRREQERLEREKKEAEERERQLMEQEQREKELLDAQRLAAEKRERERMEDELRERQRQEEERREAEKRERERLDALRRERERQREEELERERLADLENAVQERKAARLAEMRREEQRLALEREADELKQHKRLEAERREKERLEEELRLQELQEQRRRNAEQRERERAHALEREVERKRDDRRSRDKLDQLAREIEEKEKMEMEKARLLAQLTDRDRRRDLLTSRETLEKLTKPPYYSHENLAGPPYDSGDNLGDMTTKVERQVFERVDRTVWSDEPRRSASAAFDGASGADPSGLMRERMYSRKPDEDDLSRSSSRRTSRYRSKLEKARREFLSTDGTPINDPLDDRFRQTSTDAQRPRPEYRGPLLQKFHDGEFSSKPELNQMPYTSVGPSPYDQEYNRLYARAERIWSPYRQRLSQPNLYSRTRNLSTSYLETDLDTGIGDIVCAERQMEETNLDDVHRSRSVMDYDRYSRRDGPEGIASHVRSKSADYLMDHRLREESAVPENELQRFGERTPNISEHELRFRKSTEKLHVPDWYRDRRTVRTTDLDSSSYGATAGIRSPYDGTYSYGMGIQQQQQSPTKGRSSLDNTQSRYSTPFSYETGRQQTSPQYGKRPEALVVPYGMFDKYKDEIADMRRSRTSLHQMGAGDERKVPDASSPTSNGRLSSREVSTVEEISKSTHYTTALSPVSTDGRQLPGYTVTPVPSTWNVPRDRHSRVVEVTDTFQGTNESKIGVTSLQYDGRVTIEEVLDTIFQRTHPSAVNQGDSFVDREMYAGERKSEKPGIYTRDQELMQKVIDEPSKAESLLQNQQLYVCCSRCFKTMELSQARVQYISCKYCYTYYCGRKCRSDDWPGKHKDSCSFARINTLCKEVIMKVRRDSEAQWFMSKIARDGYSTLGRGSVNLRLSSTHLAQSYVTSGWSSLANIELERLLHYYSIAALIAEHKEPSLIALCRKYNPSDKFILSVSIIADMERCPSTPPPEPVPVKQQQHQQQQQQITMPPEYVAPARVHVTHDDQGFGITDEFGSAVPTEV